VGVAGGARVAGGVVGHLQRGFYWKLVRLLMLAVVVCILSMYSTVSGIYTYIVLYSTLLPILTQGQSPC